MNKVVLDVDGVLANFEKKFCQRFGFENRDKFCLEDRYPDFADEIDLFVQISTTYDALEPLEIGQQIARFCRQEGFYIHIVSSRPSHMERVTGLWLKHFKIPFDFLSVYDEWRSPKVKRIREINPLFAVDDSLKVCRDLAYYDIPSFLVDYPWNQSKFRDYGILYRIQNFQHFLQKYEYFLDK